jgi:PAS domain S-box-containing protein/putative nucleotidyltransferase with HDIG domain
MSELYGNKPVLRLYVLLPVTLLFAVIAAAVIYVFMFEQHMRTADEVKHLHHMEQRAYQEALREESEKLESMLYLLRRNQELQHAFAARDRKVLLQHAAPIFQEFLRVNNITHFYFHAPDRVNFLRVHQPERFGDAIERVTLRDAQSTNQLQSGLELGPLGTFTLRAVIPWYERSRLLGYLELGIEMQHLVDYVKEVTNTDIAITIDKQFLNREGWESGMKMLGKVPEWERLIKSVITVQTLGSIPNELLGGDYPGIGVQVEFDMRHFQMMTVPLRDIENRDIGRIFHFHDVTSSINRVQRSVASVALFSASFGVAVFAFFYVLTGRVQAELKASQLKIIEDGNEREAIQARHVVVLEQEIAARRQAENLLANSHAHLQHLLIANPAAIYTSQVDGDYALTFVSDNVQKMLGYEPQLFVDSPTFWINHVHPDDRARVLSELSMVHKTDQYVHEYRLQGKDDSYHWIQNGLKMVCDANGQPVEMVGYWIDISEQKKIEATWKEAQQRLSLHFEQTPIGVIEWNENLEAVAWNPAAENIFGYCKEEMIGQRALGIIVPEEAQEQVDKGWRNLLSGRGGAHSDNVNLTKDGQQIYCSWHNTVLTDSEDRVIGAVSLVEDVTELRSSQSAGLQSETKYRTLFESSSDAILIIEDGRFTDCNAAALSMFGCNSRHELLNKTLVDFSPSFQLDGTDSESHTNQHLASSFSEGGDHFEAIRLRLDGTEFPADIWMSLLEVDGRKIVQSTIRDITEQRQAEISILRANRALKTMVNCNETLLRAKDVEELQQEICRLLVDGGGYMLAWIGYAGDATENGIRVVSQAGECSGYRDEITVPWDGHEHVQGPVGMAIRTGQSQVIRHISQGSTLAPRLGADNKRLCQSSIAIPLRDSKRVFACISIYSAEPDIFDAEEVALLEGMAANLSYGLRALRHLGERNQATLALSGSLMGTVDAIARTVEKRDPYTAGHQHRVAQLAVAIATRMGLDNERIKGLRLGAIIHDIGKIYVPAEILNRPGKLTEHEFGMIKSHPQVGYDIMQDVQFPWPVKEMIYQHHERVDGTGYPQGLKGDEIVLEAKIIAVADVVEAITSHRPYRPAMGLDMAMSITREQAGTGLDANIVNNCVALFEEDGFEWA